MRVLPSSGYVPHSWLFFPNISDPFRLQYRPNIYLFALKTPLPSRHQIHFPPEHRWTLDSAIDAACEKLNCSRVEVDVTSIETSPPFDWMDPDDCARLSVNHHYQKVDDEYPLNCLHAFRSTVQELPSPGFIQIVLVSSHNGINRPGFLSTFEAVNPRDALAKFRDRHAGIYAPLVATRLDPAGSTNAQAEIARENPAVHWSTGMSHFPTPEALHMLPAFAGVEVGDAKAVSVIQGLIQEMVPDAPLRKIQDDCFPVVSVWSRERHELLSMHRFCSTFTPQGITVFFVILDASSVLLYIPTGTKKAEKKLWKFPANVDAPVPIICTGVLIEEATRPVVVLTDILRYGTERLARCELHDRLSRLWFNVIDSISDCPLRIKFRPIGHLTANRMMDMDASMLSRCGLHSEGVMLVAQAAPAGISFVIPALKLRVIFNTKDFVVIDAKNNDDGELVPFWIRKIECQSDYWLQGKTVRFEIGVTEWPKIVLRPMFAPTHLTSSVTHRPMFAQTHLTSSVTHRPRSPSSKRALSQRLNTLSAKGSPLKHTEPPGSRGTAVCCLTALSQNIWGAK
jgi:hypothetical protein